MATRPPCGRPIMEEIFTSIIAGLALEGLIGAGSWVDAGANDGLTACYCTLPARTDGASVVKRLWEDPTVWNLHIASWRPMAWRGRRGMDSSSPQQ